MPIYANELRELRKVLAKNATGQIGSAMAAAVKKTALGIEESAKEMAPVDTGNLQNSISTTITGDGRFGQMTAEIGPTAEYAVYQEFGTQDEEGNARTPPHPFMNPAADKWFPVFDAAVAAIVDKAL